jgi:hypothetical protein
MSDRDGENFLTRWARLKRESGEARPTPEPHSEEETAARPDEAEERPAHAAETTDRPGDGASVARTAVPSEVNFADVDFDALDINSDYTRFMQPGVPDAIRQKALRRLWVSDPVLAMPDALNDYMGDYTDAAVSVPASLLRTAYKVGRGFLDDSEVAAWEDLGRPAPTPVAAEDAPDAPPVAPAPAAEVEGEPVAATSREEPAGSSTAPEETESATAEATVPSPAPGRSQG